ncbi:PAS domain S-box-containing protein [Laceyella tengchongensis]|jgi:two-component system, sporulation sensor kinase E|uniref:histidine kinase n=1 Tax=Laceyella tengchongensis TaxID=574699 RepID=A0AA45WRW2_9BACL|nr:ATP-binding protein [Laceyella tengchongensis]SMP32534.1 PAS domain S-box-containing protein [Laceyella tengchongensis]
MINMNMKSLTDHADPSCQYLTFYPMITVERMAAQMMANIHLGVIVLDECSQVLELNPAAAKLLRLDRARVVYRSFEELVAQLGLQAQEKEQLTSFVYSAWDGQEMDWVWHDEGEERYFTLRMQALKNYEQRLAGYMLVIEDITALRLLELQVRRNSRLATIGQIAAGTAHEIRNPLTAIKGFLQVIRHKLKDSGQGKECGYIDIMLKEIGRISNLVGEILLLSKPRQTDLRAVNVIKVLREILPIIKNEALLHNIDVSFEKSVSALPVVIADGEMLKQVFLNLSKNAIEAMKRGGKLSIRLATMAEERQLQVEIIDSGSGIPEEVQEKIFEPFFTTKENGTGLGLPICRQILMELGGTIEPDSSETGTTMRVYLPLA